MIQQTKPVDNDKVRHSVNMKATLQSLFQFENDRIPRGLSEVDITKITYINYKKVIETAKDTLSVLMSEIVSIDPSSLKDALFISRLSLDHLRYAINMRDTRLDHLRNFLKEKPIWLRYIKLSRTNEAYTRFQELKEEQRQDQERFDELYKAFFEFRLGIRQIALAIVKSEMSSKESHHISDIEMLENSRNALHKLFLEIEKQMANADRLKKVVFYTPDRARILNLFQRANIAVKGLTYQLNKVKLDCNFVSQDLINHLIFEKKRKLRWYFSDKFVFQTLYRRQVALKFLIDGIDRVLQPESHKLNLYVEQVSQLGYLLKCFPEKPAAPNAVEDKLVQESESAPNNELEISTLSLANNGFPPTEEELSLTEDELPLINGELPWPPESPPKTLPQVDLPEQPSKPPQEMPLEAEDTINNGVVALNLEEIDDRPLPHEKTP